MKSHIYAFTFGDKDNKILRESIIQSFEPKISQDIFYDLNTSRVQKEYIYRNGILSKKILYTYSSNGNCEKVVENYDDFKQIRNWQKDKNGKLKERYMTEFQELGRRASPSPRTRGCRR